MQTIFRILFFLFLLLNTVPGYTADTIKIDLTLKHKLDDEGRTHGSITINQKFYTPEQVRFREINYDEHSGQISTYIFFFYAGDKLSTEECYNHNDSLLYILKHDYDAAGRENQVIRYEPGPEGLKIAGKIVKSYDENGNMTKQKDYTGKKLGVQTILSYSNPSTLTGERRKYKRISGLPFKNETRSYIYDTHKKVTQVSVTGKLASNKPFTQNEQFVYNDKGLLSTGTFSGYNHPEGLIKTYKYLDSGALSLYQESNTAGKINLILQYDYKKHYMDKGTQVSYFDLKNK